jgi:hypothetical protein
MRPRARVRLRRAYLRYRVAEKRRRSRLGHGPVSPQPHTASSSLASTNGSVPTASASCLEIAVGSSEHGQRAERAAPHGTLPAMRATPYVKARRSGRRADGRLQLVRSRRAPDRHSGRSHLRENRRRDATSSPRPLLGCRSDQRPASGERRDRRTSAAGPCFGPTAGSTRCSVSSGSRGGTWAHAAKPRFSRGGTPYGRALHEGES